MTGSPQSVCDDEETLQKQGSYRQSGDGFLVRGELLADAAGTQCHLVPQE